MLYHVAVSPGPGLDIEQIGAMTARARAGDLGVLPELRAFLDAHPEVWHQAGDLARHAMDAWIALVAGSDLAASESLARKAADMADELSGPDATPLERLLAGRVVACWLQLHYSDAAVAQAGNISLRQAAFAQKRQDSAHRRYLSAIGTLAMVRRLMPVAAQPCGFRPPFELADPATRLAGEDWARSGAEGEDGEDEDAAGPDPAMSLIAFDPDSGGSGPDGETGRSADRKVSAAS